MSTPSPVESNHWGKGPDISNFLKVSPNDSKVQIGLGITDLQLLSNIHVQNT